MDLCTGRADGACPGARCDGSGRVKDTETGLEWDRFSYFPVSEVQNHAHADSYCAGKGARLPTQAEALAVAGENGCTDAWPAGWGTWTTTPGDTGRAWYVLSTGTTYEGYVDSNAYNLHALCVR